MKQQKSTLSIELLDRFITQSAGYDVMRYVVLPELLGAEKDIILYFLGKELAKKFQIERLADLYTISVKLGWGKLELFQRKKRSITFTLMADEIFRRLDSPLTLDFRLEAGFLAEALRQIEGVNCECVEKINHNLYQVQFKVVFEK